MTEREKHAFEMAVLAGAIGWDHHRGRNVAASVVCTAAMIEPDEMPTDDELRSLEWDVNDRRTLIGSLADSYVDAQYGLSKWPPEWWQFVKEPTP